MIRFITACMLMALWARSAFAHEALIETHAATAYPYVLGKGEAVGRSALAAGASGKKLAAASAPQGAKRLAQCPGCAGASVIAPPRGTH
jgi:hypothetical protein